MSNFLVYIRYFLKQNAKNRPEFQVNEFLLEETTAQLLTNINTVSYMMMIFTTIPLGYNRLFAVGQPLNFWLIHVSRKYLVGSTIVMPIFVSLLHLVYKFG